MSELTQAAGWSAVRWRNLAGGTVALHAATKPSRQGRQVHGRLADPNRTIGTDPRVVQALAPFGLDGLMPVSAVTPDAPLDDVRLVAAPGWDIAGALAAGCQVPFAARPGQALIPVGEQPDVVGDDLVEVAQKIRGN